MHSYNVRSMVFYIVNCCVILVIPVASNVISAITKMKLLKQYRIVPQCSEILSYEIYTGPIQVSAPGTLGMSGG